MVSCPFSNRICASVGTFRNRAAAQSNAARSRRGSSDVFIVSAFSGKGAKKTSYGGSAVPENMQCFSEKAAALFPDSSRFFSWRREGEEEYFCSGEYCAEADDSGAVNILLETFEAREEKSVSLWRIRSSAVATASNPVLSEWRSDPPEKVLLKFYLLHSNLAVCNIYEGNLAIAPA